MNGIPTEIGNYKAILTFEGFTVEKEYSILEKIVNPNTGDINAYLLIPITFILIIGLIIYGKSKKLI